MRPEDPLGLVGLVLEHQFCVEQVAEEGAFSVTYRGRHVELDETVAIQCLRVSKWLDPARLDAFVKRFHDDSRRNYRLSQGDAHIVRTLAHGTTAARAGAVVPYTVFEWLEGRSLAEELEARRAEGKQGRSLEETMALLEPVADALAYAHAQALSHCDVNPSNLFLASTSEGPMLKVLDFGMAKVLAEHGVVMFAPPYAAPELHDGALGVAGPWSDVYSLALVALEVFTDQAVLPAGRPKDSARKTPRAMGVVVSEDVEAVFAKAVAVDPKERQQHVGQFWAELRAAIVGESTLVARRNRLAVAVNRAAPAFSPRDPSPASSASRHRPSHPADEERPTLDERSPKAPVRADSEPPTLAGRRASRPPATPVPSFDSDATDPDVPRMPSHTLRLEHAHLRPVLPGAPPSPPVSFRPPSPSGAFDEFAGRVGESLRTTKADPVPFAPAGASRRVWIAAAIALVATVAVSIAVALLASGQ